MTLKQFCTPVLLIVILISSLAASVRVHHGSGATKSEAESNALKSGIRSEVERILSEKLYEKNQQKIESVIVDNFRSYVLSQKTVETRDAFGVVNASVRVEPNTKRIVQVLTEEGLMPKSTSKPRIMILLDERVKGEPAFEKSATFALEQELTKRGFTVVESEQMSQIKSHEQELNDLATMGFRSGADLILKGQVSVGQGQMQTIYGISQYSVPIQMNVRVVRADNAEVVLSRSKTVRKNASDEFSAGQIGLKVGGQTVGGSVAKELTDMWEKTLGAPKSIELMASGASFEKVEEQLKKLESVVDFSLRYQEKSVALYDVSIIGTVQELREGVSQIPGWSLSLFTANRIGISSASTSSKSVQYEYTAPAIEIAEFRVDDIFPSRGKFYETHPLASVSVSLQKGVTVENLSVSVLVPEVMDMASEKRVSSVSGGEDALVEMPLLLNNKKLLANRDSRKVNAKATVSFYENGKKITRDLTVPVTLHDANAMDWAEPASIGAFVTYRNSTVDAFARKAVVAVDKTGFNDQFEEALSIFTALNKFGISYVKDPTPAGDARVLDKVQFPLETLEKKSGDCDDSSVLMAALLSAVGIDVAFISYPDHVLIMFDTGIYKKNRHKLGMNEKSVVIHSDRCWIPVETTLLKNDFFTAWRTASEEYHQAIADGQPIVINELAHAWKSFPAFSYQRTNNSVVAPDVSSEVTTAWRTIEQSLNSEVVQSINTMENAPNLTVRDQNYLGILYARNGDYSKSVKHFEGLVSDNSNASMLNNFGCALILSGDEDAGLVQIEKSLTQKKTPPALVNKALALYLKSTTPEGIDAFVAAMKDANNALGGRVTLAAMLGIELEDGTGDRAAGEHEAQAPQTVDKRRLQELLKKRVMDRTLSTEAKEKGVTTNVNVMPFGGMRGADPTQVATISDLLYWME